MRTVFTKLLALVCLVGVGPTVAFAQLSGAYTIDPNGSGSNNYTSFSSAISALNSNGVDSAVTFTVESGTYNTSIDISSAISGASSSNTITFKGKSGNRQDVIISSSGTYGIEIRRADYLIFEDMWVRHGGTYGVYINSSAEHNTFNNLRITYTGSSRTSYNARVYYCDDNTFEDCYLENAYYGMYLYGGRTNEIEGITIKNTEFYNHTDRGIYAYYTEDLVMDGIVIDSFSGDEPLYVYYPVQATLANSKIHAPSTGNYMYWYRDNYYGSSSDTSKVYNNMIKVHGRYYGIYAYMMDQSKWHNNSLDFKGQFYGMYGYYPRGKSEFVNNNWKAEGSSYAIYMYFNGGSNSVAKFDYNNIAWKGGSRMCYFERSTYANFAALQNNRSYNQNSVSVDPQFESSRDMRTYSVELNNKGTKSWVTKDIDGNPRPAVKDTNKYDIGCNEFFLPPYDLDVSGLVSPTSISTSSNTITAEIRHMGTDDINNAIVTYEYSVDSGATWTAENDTVNLKSGERYNFTFSQTWIPTRVGNFRIHVKISNSVTGDPDKNDEEYWDLCTGMAGTYTVGRKSSDFETIQDALNELECGLAGNTIFELAGGTYPQLKLQGIEGTANATLTFDGQHPDSVTFRNTSGGFEGTVDLNACEYVQIKNATIIHGSSTGTGVHIWNNSNYNLVENCEIRPSSTSSYYQNIGVSLVGSSYSAATNASYNVIKDNIISGQYYGISMRSSSSYGQVQNEIVGNLVSNFYYYSIYAYYPDSVTIHDNQLINSRKYRYSYNVYNYRGRRSKVTNNEISGAGRYAYYSYYENNSTNYESMFANNLVNGEQYYTSTYGYGIVYMYRTYDQRVYHNTITYEPNTVSNRTGFGQGAAFYAYYSYDMHIANNIFDSRDNSGTGVAFWEYNSTFDEFDHNTYLSQSGNIANSNRSNIADLSSLQSAFNGFNLNSYEDFVHYSSSGDLHLSTTKQNHRGTYLGIGGDVDGDTRCQFAPSIGADESGYPTPKTRAFFAVDDTVFINSPVQFSNQAKASDPVMHQWFVDNQYAGDDVDLEYRFSSTGSYTVKVISEGCGGLDSFSKTVQVVLPTSPPTADFLLGKTTVDVNEALTVKNISTGGADSFYWKVDSYFVRGQFGFKIKSHDYVNGTDSNSTDPEFEFLAPGTYTICLYAYNLRGSDSTCKTNTIQVRQTADMCGVYDQTDKLIGKLFDEGGPNGSYSSGRNCGYLVDPCTDKITLTINEFNVESGDFLRIYDGKDNTGTPLHDYHPDYNNGLTGRDDDANFKKTLVATSGEVYFEFSSNGSGVASGFEITWEGRQINPSTPVADFNAPDTVCVGTPFFIENLTTGKDVDFEWTMDTSAFSWFNLGDYTSRDVNHEYDKDTARTYYVKLVAENCGGIDSLVKAIEVVKPTTPPTASFTLNNSRPSIGDAVTLTDQSTTGNYPCANYWEWQITPNNYSFDDGFDEFSKNPRVLFSDTGCYDISLIVGNGAGNDTFTRTCAVYSISTCIPSVKITGTDVGISRVAIGNIDNSSDISEDGYENFVNNSSTSLEIGANYSITIERPADITNAMNRAVWVDYNQDGVFDNKTEMVVSSKADVNQTWTGNFTIPSSALNGSTRMRVGTNLGSFAQYGCGPNQFGEFEDYRVFINDDSKAPVIMFVGNQDTTIEQCSNWTDPGAYGMDNVDDSVGISGTLGSVNVNKPGDYKITYTAEDAAGNEGRDVRTVTVTPDQTAPVLTINGNNPMTVEVGSTFTDPSATATDNCGVIGGVQTVGNVDATTLGIYTLTYSATDDEGNTVSTQRTVEVVDTEKPVITMLNGADTVYLEVFTPYNEQGVMMTDNYDTNLTYNVNGRVDVNTIGTYELTYSVTDNSGNVSDPETRVVIVEDNTAPEVKIANAADTLMLDVYDDKYSVEDVFITENYYDVSSVEATLSTTGTFVSNFGLGNVPTQLGDYTVRYQAEDGSGNIGEVVRYIKVVDRIAPTIEFNEGGSVVVIPRWGDYFDQDITPSDNYYASQDITITKTGEVDVNAVGEYEVEYCAEDPSGNKSCVVRTIVVKETEVTLGRDVAEIETSIYPNPTSGQLNIQIDLPQAERVQVTIHNTAGQQVMAVANETTSRVQATTDLSQLGAGVYFVRIVTNDKHLVKKVTVSK